MIIHDNSNDYIHVSGVVVQPNCVKSGTKTNKNYTVDTYACDMIVSYKINEKTYSERIHVSGNSNYVTNQPINLMVNKSDYTKVSLDAIRGATIGYILIGISIVVVGFTCLSYYLTNRYKVYAASQGASTFMDAFRYSTPLMDMSQNADVVMDLFR